jgi:2-polyprenyl-6-methoxyphenol hydroxylase-like FAD-dependent oxidoreductase
MSERFDVVVVGARCAGSPLATLLARQGVRVALVERAEFPCDTLSTHIFEAPGINLLGRLGVLDRVRATGAEPVRRLDFRQDEFAARLEPPLRPGDIGGAMSVRRFLLDPILAEAAAEAGAEVMMQTNVTGLVQNGRVTGVRVRSGGSERVLSARLVVGADGRNSTVAKLTGARKYHVVPGQRFAYWGFFEGADAGGAPELVFHHWDGRVVIACPADSGLYQVIVIPDRQLLPQFRAGLERAFMDQAEACTPVAERLRRARRVGKLRGSVSLDSFFRESAGPGWVLVGDAGHFKDPTPGQGMTDAFRQAAAMALAIAGAIGRSESELDDAMAAWARWRDDDAFEHHWMACDLGAAGRSPAVLPAMMRRLEGRGELGRFADVFQHRALPSQVFTSRLLLSTVAAMLARGDCARPAALREVAQLVMTDARRKRLRRHPVFVDRGAHADAGKTDVSQEPAPPLGACRPTENDQLENPALRT